MRSPSDPKGAFINRGSPILRAGIPAILGMLLAGDHRRAQRFLLRSPRLRVRSALSLTVNAPIPGFGIIT